MGRTQLPSPNKNIIEVRHDVAIQIKNRRDDSSKLGKESRDFPKTR